MRANYQNKSVEIEIRDDLIKNICNYFNTSTRYLLVTDANVHRLYGHYFPAIEEFYIIPAGEENKTIDEALKLIKFMLDNNFQKNDVIIAFGGGVVGDLAGF